MNPVVTSSRSPRSFWPHAIIGWFIVFIVAMAAWVAVAVRQDMDLVSTDYYEQEIQYQSQIDRLHRTQEFTGQTRINYEARPGAVLVALPADHASARGTIRLYRPSDAKLDREVEIALDAGGTQRIRTAELRPGLWRVRVQWNVGGKEFYLDRPILIPAGAAIRG